MVVGVAEEEVSDMMVLLVVIVVVEARFVVNVVSYGVSGGVPMVSKRGVGVWGCLG
jgi:hypothetical protein